MTHDTKGLFGFRSPRHLPAELGDRVIAAMRKYGDMQICCVITTRGRVDEERLRRAARLSYDAEPVLGCRFEARSGKARWERQDDIDGYPFLQVAPVRSEEERERLTERFLVDPTDDEAGPRARLLLLRDATDRLIVKMDHRAADTGGTRQYCNLLAEIYRKLALDPSYVPEPNLLGDRSFDQVWRRIRRKDRAAILAREIRSKLGWGYPRKYWHFPTPGERPSYAIVRVGPERFAALESYRKQHGATVNDVVVAAFYRALHAMAQPPPGTPLRLVLTADLRRYLPGGRAGALAVLSGWVYLNIGPRLGATLDDTVGLVHERMERMKGSFIGLDDYNLGVLAGKALPYEWFRRAVEGLYDWEMATGQPPLGFTNLARIDDRRLDFGDVELADAYLTPSVGYSPSFMPGVSGFRDTLTFTVGYMAPEAGEDRVPRLMDSLLENLPG